MRIAAILGGGLLGLAASAAMAGSYPERYDDDRYGPTPAYDPSYRDEEVDADRYDGGYHGEDRYGPQDAPELPGVWDEGAGGFYMYGHRGAPRPCDCRAGGLALSPGFFDGYGGVGPIPDGGYYGGGYYIAYGAASSRAFASASARASASVSVRYRGHGGRHGHKGGGKHR